MPGLSFGVFLAPYHPLGDSPLITYRRDLEIIEWCDRLGFDEAWVGEHHSAAWENIPDPAMFLAAAGQRTQRIRLGSGVVSLPYHHPMMVADSFVQLDYLTNGRAMLGVGPGALISDAVMMGIDPVTQRVFTQDLMSRTVTVFDGAPVMSQSLNQLPRLAQVNTVTNEKLSAAVLKGKQIFYNATDTRMSRDAYISCASCLVDGSGAA